LRITVLYNNGLHGYENSPINETDTLTQRKSNWSFISSRRYCRCYN